MKKTSITVTEAARNFADCVNRVHYQNVTFVLLKNGEPFAAHGNNFKLGAFSSTLALVDFRNWSRRRNLRPRAPL
jgi:hypothetical protein